MQVHRLNLFLSKHQASSTDCFDHALEVLRDSWNTTWCGLPQVLHACIEFLDFQESELTLEVRQMLSASNEVAEMLESMCQNGSHYAEPPYHNRLHTADVMVAMVLQISIEAKLLNARAPEWFSAGLLTAVIHDFAHPGRVNGQSSEIEKKSFSAVLPILVKHGLPSKWLSNVQYAVERSDFALVAENHQRVQDLPFQWNQDWLAVLLNEADILGSSISAYGESLSQALSEEWRLIDFPAAETVATRTGRSVFLKSLHFSSNAACELKVQEKIAAQMQ
jgi:hypothetical protein